MTSLGFSPGAIGPLGFWYLTLFGGLIPWAAIRTKRRVAERPLPPKKRYFVSVIIQQLIFLAATLTTAYFLGVEVFGRYRPTVAHLGLSLVMLGAAVAVLQPKGRDQVTRRARRSKPCRANTGIRHGVLSWCRYGRYLYRCGPCR